MSCANFSRVWSVPRIRKSLRSDVEWKNSLKDKITNYAVAHVCPIEKRVTKHLHTARQAMQGVLKVTCGYHQPSRSMAFRRAGVTSMLASLDDT